MKGEYKYLDKELEIRRWFSAEIAGMNFNGRYEQAIRFTDEFIEIEKALQNYFFKQDETDFLYMINNRYKQIKQDLKLT